MPRQSPSELIKEIALKVEKLEKEIQIVEQEMQSLEKQGLIFAYEHWLRDSDGQPKYLYLIYPLEPGQKQKKQYIGSKKEKIKEAIGSLERTKRYQILKDERQKITQKITVIFDLLKPVETFLC